MTTYAEHVERDRRLIILRLLADNNGALNDRTLQGGLKKWGIRCTVAAVTSSLAWLAEQGFCKVSAVDGSKNVRLAEITARGRELAEGLAEAPGVTPRRIVADC